MADFLDVARRRRMVRSFRGAPVPAALLDRVLAPAMRAPTAGNCAGVTLVVLRDGERERYWDTTLPQARRAGFPWPGLLDAPVLVLIAAEPARYLARYREADKQRAGLGGSAEAWPQPLWFVDAGMAALAILYGAVDAGLGACFFGVFDHEAALRDAFGIPDGVRLAGTIALGFADEANDRRSRSSGRPRRSDVVRFGRWE